MQTRKLLSVAGSAVTLLASAGPAVSQSGKLCAGLTGQQRTNCLRAESNRHAADAARHKAYADSLGRTVRRGCSVVGAADVAAQAADYAGAERKDPRLMAAGAAWSAGRMAGDAATRGGASRACEEPRERRR